MTILGDLLDFGQLFKDFGKIYLLKSPTFFGIFCKGVKTYHLSGEIIFGQLLYTFGDFFWSHYHHCGCYRVPNAHEPIIKVIGTLFSLPHVTGRASNSSLSKLSVTIATEFFLYNSIVIISFGYEMK